MVNPEIIIKEMLHVKNPAMMLLLDGRLNVLDIKKNNNNKLKLKTYMFREYLIILLT